MKRDAGYGMRDRGIGGSIQMNIVIHRILAVRPVLRLDALDERIELAAQPIQLFMQPIIEFAIVKRFCFKESLEMIDSLITGGVRIG